MNTIEAIQAKRDGRVLSESTIRELIAGYTHGEVPDYQMSALLMAIFFNGLSSDELAHWTTAMLESGSVMDWSALGRPCVDKHSTGGVGDKISLPLAPAVAACGAAVPMVSGRALGHTGGTLDKLESIPGFNVRLSSQDARRAVEELGLVLMGQTDEVAPADRLLYSLRDVTSTVESIPLISSSIMSKKLAEGIEALVLDVKVGSGAFMPTLERAQELAETLVSIGKGVGCKTVAYLTRMDRPLGVAVGNALEVAESIEVLRGGGPADVRELTEVLGGEMLALTGMASDADEGRARIAASLDDGSALSRFRALVEMQGGDPSVVDEPATLPRATHQIPVEATDGGTVIEIDTKAIGRASMALGAGRAVAADPIDPAVGIEVLKTVGESVATGEPLVRLHANDVERADEARRRVIDAYRIGEGVGSEQPLVLARVE